MVVSCRAASLVVLWAARLRSWGTACAVSPRSARIVRLVWRREDRVCLSARPRAVNLALARRLEAGLGACRVARDLALIAVLGQVAPRWYRMVRECLRLGGTRGLEVASMAIRCVALREGSVVLPARVCAGLARC